MTETLKPWCVQILRRKEAAEGWEKCIAALYYATEDEAKHAEKRIGITLNEEKCYTVLSGPPEEAT